MENLQPAMQNVSSPENLNVVEFQSVLKSWLEDKGVIADIQSHIRFKMVNILKNTTIGRNICRKLSQNISLSKQALNMIIAEYLLRNDYEYSLSLFNTEAFLINVFPEIALQKPNDNEVPKNLFDCKNVLNILDLIGIPKYSMIGKDILKIYFQEPNCNTILDSLVHILNLQTNKNHETGESEPKYVDLTNEPNLVKQIINYLNEFNIPVGDIKCLTDTIKKLYFSEIQEIEEKHFNELLHYKKELETKEKLVQNITKSNKKLEMSILKLANEYHSLQLHTESLEQKKATNDISNNKENLARQNNCNTQITIETQKELNCVLPHCEEICKLNCDTIQKVKGENLELKKENYDLKSVNREQQKEIILLSKRYNNLMNAFRDCQNKILLLTTKVGSGSTQSDQSCKQAKSKGTKPKFEVNVPSTENSSESITEEIVREARQRLRVLEEESKAIEAKFSSIHTII